jgi:hypothetical protein
VTATWSKKLVGRSTRVRRPLLPLASFRESTRQRLPGTSRSFVSARKDRRRHDRASFGDR